MCLVYKRACIQDVLTSTDSVSLNQNHHLYLSGRRVLMPPECQYALLPSPRLRNKCTTTNTKCNFPDVLSLTKNFL